MNLVTQLIGSPWFWADILLSISGGVVVAWGLKIEKKAEKMMPPTDFDREKHVFADVIEKAKKEEERGWKILMTGIVMEVIAAFIISVLSGLEIADADNRSSAAILEAKKAEKQTAEVVSNNFVLRTNVDSLSLAVLNLAHQYDLSTNALKEAEARLAQSHEEAAELETKLKPRNITAEQQSNFVAFLKNFPVKVPIWVMNCNPNSETTALSYQVRKMLNDAGFGTNNWDMNPCPMVGAAGTFGGGVFSLFSANADNVNGDTLMIMVNSDGMKFANFAPAILNAFTTSGIKAEYTAANMLSNTIAIWIPDKP